MLAAVAAATRLPANWCCCDNDREQFDFTLRLIVIGAAKTTRK